MVSCRSSSKDITELHAFVLSLVDRINKKFSSGSYKPIVWVERPVSLYEKIALYSIADVAVVTATRDGMNLVPYEYVVCRQGAPVRLAFHSLCLVIAKNLHSLYVLDIQSLLDQHLHEAMLALTCFPKPSCRHGGNAVSCSCTT